MREWHPSVAPPHDVMRRGLISRLKLTSAEPLSSLPVASPVVDPGSVGFAVGSPVVGGEAVVDIPVVASGGVTSVDDVQQLAAAGLAAAIIGRALYADKITLPEALDAAQTQENPV